MSTANITTRSALAEEALETLLALRRHAEGCRQCRIDVEYCSTNATYTQNFERLFDNWIRTQTRGKS